MAQEKTRYWDLLIFVVLIVVLRLGALLTNINNLHSIFAVEIQQLALARWLDGQPHLLGKLYNILAHYLAVLLPMHRQFHGFILLNNVLVFLMSRLFGIHYYVLHLTALLYHVVTYVCWALLLKKRFGARAFVIFSLLFLFAPQGFISSGLNLMGSHVEGMALTAILFFLAFYNDRAWSKYLFFLLIGVFFFLEKTALLLLPVLLLPVLRALPKNGQKFSVLPLFALGFVPLLLIQNKYGWYSHNLQDGFGSKTWFTIFSWSHLNWSAWHLPSLALEYVKLAFWPKNFYTLVFTACFIFLVLQSLAQLSPRYRHDAAHRAPERGIIPYILLYTVLYDLAFFCSVMELDERFFLPLYPFILVVVALALGQVKNWIVVPVVGALLFFLVPDNLSLIKPGNTQILARYKYIDYEPQAVRYVPQDELDFVDWWYRRCPENDGFRVLYRLLPAAYYPIKPQNVELKLHYEKLKAFLIQKAGVEREILALGMAMGIRTRHNEKEFDYTVRNLKTTPENEQWLRAGFDLAPRYTEMENCP